MNLDEIKSPLPARKINTEIPPENEDSNLSAIPENRQTITEPSEPVVAASASMPVKKPIKLQLWHWILIGVAVVILIVAIVLNVVKKQPVAETVNLTYWGLWEDPNIMNSVISDFESKNPNIKISYKRNVRSDYRTRLAGKLAKTGTEGAENIDIFRIHNTWIPMFRDYVEAVPSDVANNIGLENDFLDVYKTDLKENNKWLSVPIMYDGLALFYNKDLLDQAKIEVPKGWWELQKAAIKLTTRDENGAIKIAGAGLGIANGNVDHWSDILGLMMKQNGIDFGKKTNMDKNLEDALKYYASFAKSADKVWDESMPNTTTAFASGKLAFYFAPSWRVFDLENLNKDLKYGITTVPQLPINGDITAQNTELTDVHWASYWTEGVNNKSQHKQEAWKFLEYLSSKEVLEKLYTAQSQVRSFGEIYPRKSMSDKLKDNAKVWPFLSVANKASSWYLASETGDAGLNTEMQKYFTDAINNMTTDGDSTELMTTLKSGISQLQQKYSLKR